MRNSLLHIAYCPKDLTPCSGMYRLLHVNDTTNAIAGLDIKVSLRTGVQRHC